MHTSEAPGDGCTVTKGERPMTAGFIVVRQRSTGPPAVTARTSAGHRPKISSFAERIGRWPNSLPAAAIRQPLGDFTTLFKVKKIGRRATDLAKQASGKNLSGNAGFVFLGRCLKLVNHQIRHQATHKVGYHPEDCICGHFNLPRGFVWVCMD